MVPYVRLLFVRLTIHTDSSERNYAGSLDTDVLIDGEVQIDVPCTYNWFSQVNEFFKTDSLIYYFDPTYDINKPTYVKTV